MANETKAESRYDKYLVSNKAHINFAAKRLLAALANNHKAFVRIELETLAQHHTDLENAIEGNG